MVVLGSHSQGGNRDCRLVVSSHGRNSERCRNMNGVGEEVFIGAREVYFFCCYLREEV